MPTRHWLLPYLFLLAVLQGCFHFSSSDGGGQTDFVPPRLIDPQDVALPAGFQIEVITTGLTFPTGVTFDERGQIYVIESGYAYGEVWTIPRLLHIKPDGTHKVVAEGGRNGPWTGVTFHEGSFYLAEGGEREGGRILRITPDGRSLTLIDQLPGMGDHHTNGPVIHRNGWLYWGQGTATNSGVVGPDNAEFGWLSRYPQFHDIPCQDVTLTGKIFSSPHSLPDNSQAITGAFSPFGTGTAPGQVIPGHIPCHGAVLRMPVAGGAPELVAWGFRNPFGLAVSPDGRLYVTDNSYDDRGSRPVFGTGDLLWEVRAGAWYGWPDFHGQHRLDEESRYTPAGAPPLTPLLQEHPQIPPAPVATFGVHSSSNGLDFSTNPEFGFAGQAFVAQFGDQAPATGKVLAPVGFRVVRVERNTGRIHPYAMNKGATNGPASWLKRGGLERPVAVKFSADGSALYIVDFGVMTMGDNGPVPRKETGVLWRITKQGKS
jgi:glucose/arabinose dehydrogenase